MAPYIDDWREEVRRWASTDLVRRVPQDDTGKDRGRPSTKSNRDDTDGSGGGDGGGRGGGPGNGNGNSRASAGGGNGGDFGSGGGGGGRGNGAGGATGGSGRGGDGNGAAGGGGGRFNGNNNSDKDNSNSDDNNGGGGRNKNTDNDRGGNNRGTLPALPPPATAAPGSSESPSSTDSPSPTDTTSTIPDPSTIVLVSTVTPTPSAAAPILTSFIPLLTATSLPDTDPSAPRKGLDDPASPSGDLANFSYLITGTALADTNPTPTALAAGAGIGDSSTNNSNGDKNGDRFRGSGNNGNRFKNNNNNNGKGLDPVAERVLISVGSIGGFILICFLIWIVWRMVKKSKARKNGGIDPPNSRRWPRLVLPDRVLAKVPFLEKRQRQWQNLDDSSVTGLSPPSYESGMAQVEPVKEFYAQEKTYQLPSRRQSMDQATDAHISNSPLAQNAPNLAFTNRPLTLDSNIPYSRQPELAQNPPGLAYTNSPLTLNTTITQPWSHQQQQSFSSTNAAQFGGMHASTGETDTFRSRMPDAYYNQSELARGPSDAYDPARRQVNRVSQLSSISSGFGDGDIIVPDNMIKQPQPASTNLRQSTSLVGRFSWVSQSAQSRRDTVYTQASEDSPPRFRNVSSWVNQQTGRVKRAQQRLQDGQDVPPVPVLSSQQVGVPGIHNPPAEQSFNMMMGDDEVPRRVEDTFVSPQR